MEIRDATASAAARSLHERSARRSRSSCGLRWFWLLVCFAIRERTPLRYAREARPMHAAIEIATAVLRNDWPLPCLPLGMAAAVHRQAEDGQAREVSALAAVLEGHPCSPF